jgi:hypothetical protein
MMKFRVLAGGLLGIGLFFVSVGLFSKSLPSAKAQNQTPEFTDQTCLDCHTDETRLKELAPEPEAPAESLSSGPG